MRTLLVLAAVVGLAALSTPAAQAGPGLRHEVTSVDATAFFGEFLGTQHTVRVRWSAPAADISITIEKSCGLRPPPGCSSWTIHDTVPVADASLRRDEVAFAGSIPSSHAPDGTCDYWAVLEGDASPVSLAPPHRAEDGTIRQPTHDRTQVLRGRGDPTCWAGDPYVGGHPVTGGWMDVRGEYVVTGAEDVPHVP